MDETKVVYLDPKTLNGNPANWRIHPERQKDALRQSLEEFGWLEPLVYNIRTQRLVDGHARVDEAVTRGVELVPVTVIDVDEVVEKALLATCDRLPQMAEVDTHGRAMLLCVQLEKHGVLPIAYQDAETRALLNEILGDGGGGGEPDPEATTRVLTIMVPSASFDSVTEQLLALQDKYGVDSFADVLLEATREAIGESDAGV